MSILKPTSNIYHKINATIPEKPRTPTSKINQVLVSAHERNNKKQIHSTQPLNFIFILISQFSSINIPSQTQEALQSIIPTNLQHYNRSSSLERQGQIIKRRKFRVPEERILHEHVKRNFLMAQSEFDEALTTVLGPRVGVPVLCEHFVASLRTPQSAIVELCEVRLPQKVSTFDICRRPLVAGSRRHRGGLICCTLGRNVN